jgi:uncharacterized protein (DUF433 family)
MATVASYPYISTDPQIFGGKPIVDGQRIRVLDVAILHLYRGLEPSEICGVYPTLTLAHVHAALTWFYDHRDDMIAAIEQERQTAEAFRKQHPDLVR